MTTLSRVQRRRIGEILVDQGIVAREQVEEALRLQRKTGESLGAILIDMGCVSDLDITRTIVTQYQLPYIHLDNYRVSDKVCELFPQDFLYEHKLVPFDQVGGMVLCAVSEVPDEDVLAEIPRLTQRNVALYVSSMTEIDQCLQRISPLSEEAVKEMAERKRRTRQGSTPGGSATQSGSKPKAAAGKTKIFAEDSSEAILQALDDTWDSIFDSIGDGEEPAESDD